MRACFPIDLVVIGPLSFKVFFSIFHILKIVMNQVVRADHLGNLFNVYDQSGSLKEYY